MDCLLWSTALYSYHCICFSQKLCEVVIILQMRKLRLLQSQDVHLSFSPKSLKSVSFPTLLYEPQKDKNRFIWITWQTGRVPLYQLSLFSLTVWEFLTAVTMKISNIRVKVLRLTQNVSRPPWQERCSQKRQDLVSKFRVQLKPQGDKTLYMQ